MLQAVEGLHLLPETSNDVLNVSESATHFITAGSKGVLRVWNAASAQCVFTQDNELVIHEGNEVSSQQIHMNLLNCHHLLIKVVI